MKMDDLVKVLDIDGSDQQKTVKNPSTTNLRNFKRRVILTAVIGVALILVLTFILGNFYYKGYKKAQAKAEETISELTAALERFESEAAVYEEASKEITFAVLETNIQDIGKLVTAEYWYTDVGQYEGVKQIWGVDVAMTKKSFLVKWSGVITAGVDLTKSSVGVDETGKMITVFLPKAEIISHDPDNESFETINEKSGLFNPIKVDDVREFDINAEKAMIERAKAGSLLDKAEENAKSIISKLIQANPQIRDNYTVTVKFIEE